MWLYRYIDLSIYMAVIAIAMWLRLLVAYKHAIEVSSFTVIPIVHV